MTFSPDGHYFVGTTNEHFDNFVILWHDFEQVSKLELRDEIQQAAISADSRYLYTFNPHRTSNPERFRMQFDVIDLDTRQWIATLDTEMELNQNYPQVRFALSPDGQHLVYVFEEQVFLIPLPTWKEVVH
jgi:putative heme iron utilization protein